MKRNTVYLFRILVICLSFFYVNIINAAYLRDFPVSVTQPNGEVLNLFATGDEFYNWLHDRNNFTIIQNHRTGYWEYAKKENDELVPSGYIAGKVDPGSIGLQPGINISPGKIMQIRQAILDQFPNQNPINNISKRSSGQFSNLVIFIRFSDQNEFTDDTTYYYAMFDDPVPGNVSMYNYYKEASFNKLNLWSYFLFNSSSSKVVSFQDSHPRSYYVPYDSITNSNGYKSGEASSRESTLLKAAVNGVKSQVPVSLNLDGNNDSYIDNVCFIVQGSPTAWATLLWPHMSGLGGAAVINGKKVGTYNFLLQNHLTGSGAGVLCHEMFHTLGAPDLYHYSFKGISAVGCWDLMESTSNPPQSMGAFMKFKYGKWIDSIPEITASGRYTLHPVTSKFNNAYKILTPASTTEYFVVEYRRQIGTFEGYIPGSGLLIYRIDPKAGNGNAGGPPDEVFIFRPGGDTNSSGIIENAYFNATVHRTAINNNTNPRCYLQDGSSGYLDISNISIADTTISFDVKILFHPIVDFTVTHRNICPGTTITFTDITKVNPTQWNWKFQGGYPYNATTSVVNVKYDTLGTYLVFLKASNKYGDDSIIKKDWIHVSELAVDAGKDISLVCGSSVRINPVVFYSGSQPLTYRWKPSTGLSDTTILNPFCSVSTPVNYIITVTDGTNTASDTIAVVTGPLQATIDPVNPVICSKTVKLNAKTNIPVGDFIRVNSPRVVKIFARSGSFGPTMQSVFKKGNLAYEKDNSNNYDGCSPTGYPSNIFTGKIAMIDNGNCMFGYKCLKAQQAGAIGVVIVNQIPGGGTSVMGTDSWTSQVNIPCVMISYEDGQYLRNLIQTGLVNITMGFDCDNLTFSWTPPDHLTSTTIPNPVASPLITTIYTVTVQTGSCSAQTNVTVKINPSLSVNLGKDTAICYGDSVTLDAHNTGLSFLWSNGKTTQKITVHTSGSYFVTVTRANGCYNADTIDIYLSFVPVKAAIPSGFKTFCHNPANAIYLTDTLSYADSYDWHIEPSYAGSLNASANQVIVDWNDTFSGTVRLFVRAQNKCGIGEYSDTLLISIIPDIPKPVISWNYSTYTLTSSAPTGNQWCNQDGNIPGATGQTYHPSSSGYYYVIVIISGCASDQSDIITINTGLENQILPVQFNIIPNPNNGAFRILYTGPNNGMVSIKLTDALGKCILMEKSEPGRNQNQFLIDIKPFVPEGIYFIELTANGQSLTKKIVIRRQ